MKKTILCYSALLFTVAVSAQTTVQSGQTASSTAQVEKQAEAVKVKGSGSASATTTIQTDAAAKAESKAKAELAAKKEMIAHKKDQVETTGQTTVEKVANKEVSVNAFASSNTNVNAGENLQEVNANGSLNTGTTVSLNKLRDNTKEVKKEVATRIENKTNATLQKTTEVTTVAHTKVSGAAHQTGAVAASKSTKVVSAVKAKPAPLKIKSKVNTAAGIKLR